MYYTLIFIHLIIRVKIIPNLNIGYICLYGSILTTIPFNIRLMLAIIESLQLVCFLLALASTGRIKKIHHLPLVSIRSYIVPEMLVLSKGM